MTVVLLPLINECDKINFHAFQNPATAWKITHSVTTATLIFYLKGSQLFIFSDSYTVHSLPDG